MKQKNMPMKTAMGCKLGPRCQTPEVPGLLKNMRGYNSTISAEFRL